MAAPGGPPVLLLEGRHGHEAQQGGTVGAQHRPPPCGGDGDERRLAGEVDRAVRRQVVLIDGPLERAAVVADQHRDPGGAVAPRA